MTEQYVIETKLFDGSDILFVITPKGDPLIPVRVLVDYFDLLLEHANRIVTRNRDLFADKLIKLKTSALPSSDDIMSPDYRLKSVDCFTIAGGVIS